MTEAFWLHLARAAGLALVYAFLAVIGWLCDHFEEPADA